MKPATIRFPAGEPHTTRAVSSAYVAYRGAVPFEKVRENNVSETDVVVYVSPGCHFVQYPLRGGGMFNQVAVFESPRARAGGKDWGTPDELDAAFAHATGNVRKGLPLMGRDRWWPMFDRDPVMNWVYGRVALLGDAAHPPPQRDPARPRPPRLQLRGLAVQHHRPHPGPGAADVRGDLAGYPGRRSQVTPNGSVIPLLRPAMPL